MYEKANFCPEEYITLLNRVYILKKCMNSNNPYLLLLDFYSLIIPIGQGEWIRTRCGTIRRSQLLPQITTTSKLDSLTLSDPDVPEIPNQEVGEDIPTHNATILPTEVSSRLGKNYLQVATDYYVTGLPVL